MRRPQGARGPAGAARRAMVPARGPRRARPQAPATFSKRATPRRGAARPRGPEYARAATRAWIPSRSCSRAPSVKLGDRVSPGAPGGDPLTHPIDGAVARYEHACAALVAREEQAPHLAAGRPFDGGADDCGDHRSRRGGLVDDDDERPSPALDAPDADAGQRGFARELGDELLERARLRVTDASGCPAADSRADRSPERCHDRRGGGAGQLDQSGRRNEQEAIVAGAGADGPVREIEADGLSRIERGSRHRSLLYTRASKKVSNPAGTRELALTAPSTTSAAVALAHSLVRRLVLPLALAVVGAVVETCAQPTPALGADANDEADSGLDAGAPAWHATGPF